MSDGQHGGPQAKSRVRAEMLDSFDEELELEMDDDRLDEMLAKILDDAWLAPRLASCIDQVCPTQSGAVSVPKRY